MQTSRCHWHWFQTKWTYHFSPRYFNGIKMVTYFKCIFEEIMPKLSVNFVNHISLDSHKNQYPFPVCNFGFTVSQYSDKCWLDLPLLCRIFLFWKHTEITRSPARSSDSCSGWFVWNHNQVKKSLDRLFLFSFIHPFTALTLIFAAFQMESLLVHDVM